MRERSCVKKIGVYQPLRNPTSEAATGMLHLGLELRHVHHGSLAIHQLRKVEDYVRERLAEDISVAI